LTVNTATGLISGAPTQTGTFNATLNATNAWGTDSAPLTLFILTPDAPVITSSATASGLSGSVFSYQITATNTPTSYGATGIPSWLSVNASTGLISGTPTQTGTFNATISATNPGGTGSAVMAITVQKPFDAWKKKNFSVAELSDESISGDNACPFHDGISNLMKYALNKGTYTNCASGMPLAKPMSIGNSSYLTLTYTEVLSASDIIYTVEVSGDLQTWGSGDGHTALVSATNNTDGVTRSVMIQDTTPITNSLLRFMRLKVTRP